MLAKIKLVTIHMILGKLPPVSHSEKLMDIGAQKLMPINLKSHIQKSLCLEFMVLTVK